MTLAERLKNARESLGKNQKEISALLGISKAAWQGYEAGENIPGGQVFESLTKLGFNGTWLLTGEGEMRRGGRAAPERPAAPRAEDPRLAVLMEKLECIYKEGDMKEKALVRGLIEELYDEVCEEKKDMKGEKAA